MTGAELKALRKSLGLSLAQASRQVEVSSRTWCRWESGDQRIPDGAVKLFKMINMHKTAHAVAWLFAEAKKGLKDDQA